MYEALLDILHAYWKNGLTLSATGTAVYYFMKQRRVKRMIRRRFPWLHIDDSDVMNYEARQIRIEEDVRALRGYMEAIGCLADWKSGKDEQRPTDGLPKNSSPLQAACVPARSIGASTPLTDSYHSKTNEGSTQTMKEYLKKLGRTKFQAFLVTTITNVALIIGYALNYDDIQSRVGAEAPLILAGAQLLAGVVYQAVEGSVDKAQVKTEVKTDDSYTTRDDAGDVYDTAG